MKKNRLYVKVVAMLMIMAFVLSGCNKQNVNDTATTTEAVEEATTEAVTTEEAKGEPLYELMANNINEWEADGKKCAQIDCVLYNHSDETVPVWKVVIAVPDGSTLDQSWNGEYKLDGKKLSVEAVDYNKEIASGASVPFGFIIKTPDHFNPADFEIYIDGKKYDGATKKVEATTEEENTEASEPKKEAESGTPLDNHGKLSVKGTKIVDKDGKPFGIRGISTHGMSWFPEYVNKDAFKSLRDDMDVNTIRLAMYSDENMGYCTGGDQKKLKSMIDSSVKDCNELGMYVIIDWHVLGEQNPKVHQKEAEDFFKEVSSKYKDYDNVIYEICNEPNGGTTWKDVKSYAEDIIPIIRKNDPDAIIIVGTPTWSQDVDVAADDPIKGQTNVVYALHFYAATHKDDLRNKAKKALDKGLPIIVSECSICDASGNGGIDYDSAEKWMKFIEDNDLGVCAWNLSNKDETSSIIKSGCTKTSGWSESDLSDAGKWFKKQYTK